MHLHEFDFHLPKELIARYPLEERSASRLLCIDKQNSAIAHRNFTNLLELLSPKDVLVFNNTRVIPARWYGMKLSGGRVEVLVERILNHDRFLAHVRASKSPKIGSQLSLDTDIIAHVINRHGELFELAVQDDRSVLALLELYGHIPLPHYMARTDETLDRTRYQTVYATHNGAVAAPTAGLHFDEKLLSGIKDKGVAMTFLTLHVGAGTFQPVREEVIENHRMHAEYIEVSEVVCASVHAAKKRGGRVIAVGTTTVRALETASQQGELSPYKGDTRLFIYPGYNFRCVDAMITNFHLPETSLLMMVCAFGGYSLVMEAYRQAIQQQYRFYSYGDAMWIGQAYAL